MMYLTPASAVLYMHLQKKSKGDMKEKNRMKERTGRTCMRQILRTVAELVHLLHLK